MRTMWRSLTVFGLAALFSSSLVAQTAGPSPQKRPAPKPQAAKPAAPAPVPLPPHPPPLPGSHRRASPARRSRKGKKMNCDD